MEKLYFIFVIILGSVLYNVAEVSTQEWDNQQFLNNMPEWFESYQRQSALANQNGNGVGDQTAVNPIDQLVSDLVQQFVPSRDNKTNSYDLTDAMRFFNASYGFPTVGAVSANKTHNGSDDEVAAFATMFNAAASALLKPESISNYLNLLQNASVNPSVASGDNITSDALAKQFEREYQVYLNRFTETLHSNQTNDTTGVSQNDINDVVGNINHQLTEILQIPNNGN